ncbi:hypothetical protein FDP41_004329 [Naegleria fowleri]|uniref:Uncharacterized protein n=1 Tax=Naegleria fowleri TaxID=5763 RepID=A0A6A5BRJ6_NAEFO|nr:uncharacterized protein FDP41_004329 [Naegleria fowleri]KAF0976430.1 hypothetical protein FDP41_004329 [Naegleria fowleri]
MNPPLFKYVSLPITTQEQADELIKLSLSVHALPSLRTQNGKKIWYLTPNQFKLTNPHWDKMISDVVEDSARRGLGVSSKKQISHELEYLVLYQEGSVDFHRGKKHTTHEHHRLKAEKQPFAKLIVQLPSVYNGGVVIVRYNEKEVQYDFSDSSSYLPSYISMYDECDREECSIQSGYRLCLVYKIVFTGGVGRVPKFDHGAQISHDLTRIVDEWSDQEIPMAFYPLSNVYSQTCFNFESLKDDDALIFNLLNTFNARYSLLHLFLAVFEKKALTTAKSNEPQNITYRASSLLGPNNDTRFQKYDLTLDVSSIFPFDTLQDMPFKEKKQCGNGMIELRCTCTCLIIIPKKVDYMFWAYTDPMSCYKGFLSLYKQYKSDPTRRDACIRLALSQKDSPSFKNNITELVPILIDLKDTNLLKTFIASASANITLGTWNVILSQFSMDDLKQEFLSSVVQSTCANANSLGQRLQASIEMVSKFNNLQLSQEFITRIIETVSTNTALQFICIQVIGILLNAVNSLQLPITPAFKKVLVKRLDNYVFSDKIMGIVTSVLKTCLKNDERQICDTIVNSMFQTVTPQILENSLEGFIAIIHLIGLELTMSRVQNVLKNINSIPGYLSIMTKLQTNYLESNSENHKEAFFIFKECKQHVINAFHLMQNLDLSICQQVLSFFWKCKLVEDITVLTSTIIVKAGTDYETLLALIHFIDKNLGLNAFQHIAFNSILLNCSNIVKVHLSQASTSTGQDWSFNVETMCHCNYCQPAEQFLKDKTQRQVEFRHAEKYRNHITERVKCAVGDNSKYLKFETIKTGSPYGFPLRKLPVNNSGSSSSSQVPGYIVTNSPTGMSSSNSNASIASTSSSSGVKRVINHSSSSSSLNPPNKKSKER